MNSSAIAMAIVGILALGRVVVQHFKVYRTLRKR